MAEPRPLPAWGVREIGALITLSLGMFTLVTSEQLPIGVLAVQAADLHVSAGTAGLSVTVPGVVAASLAILAPVLIRELDRRLVIVLALAVTIVSMVASAVAPTFEVLLLSRVLAGVGIGLYWPILPVVALRQAPPERGAVALSLVFAGNAGAIVLGVPFVAWLGAVFSWRASYAAVGALALLVLLAALLLVRPVRTGQKISLRAMAAATRTAPVRWAAAMTLMLVTGHFAAYSFVSPLLIGRAGAAEEQVGGLLLAFGLLGILGNFLATPLLKHRPSRLIAGLGAGITLTLLAVLVFLDSLPTAWLLMPLWGLFAGALSVSIQAFVSRAGADAGVEEQAAAVNSSMFSVSIAVGAAFGGLLFDTGGAAVLLIGAAVLSALAILAALGAARGTRF